MDLTSGYPYWPAAAGLLGVYPPLRADTQCRVAIIGGGLTGALIGYRLAQAGVDAVLLDKRDFGWGSTSASTALLQYELDVPLTELIERVGERNAVAAYRMCRDAIGGFEQLVGELGEDCGFNRRPSLLLASKRRDVKGLKEEYESRKRQGFAVEYWDRKTLQQYLGIDRAAALFTPESAEVDPYRLTHGLIRKATEWGLRAYDRTEVTGRKVVQDAGQESRAELTTTDGNRITADRVIDATGYEAAQQLGGESEVQLRNTYAFISEPLGPSDLWYQRALIWETSRPYLYLRTTPDGRIIAGGLDDRFANPDKRDHSLPRKTAKLIRQFGQLFPEIRIEPAFCWAGTFAETGDGLPYVGPHPEFPGVLFALCFGGNGSLFALIAADLIRDACLGRGNANAHLFGFTRSDSPSR
jgi:glycine/D-amino acid oxidase-like deaminating enzyme